MVFLSAETVMDLRWYHGSSVKLQNWERPWWRRVSGFISLGLVTITQRVNGWEEHTIH